MGFLTSIFSGNAGGGFQSGNAPTTQQTQQTYQRTSDAYNQQQDLTNQAGQQGGFANQQNVFGQMQGLAGQLSAQAQGQGPNPALAQLNQTTGQNIASQASLAAGQRGSSANAGMIARQTGQQGAAIQQQAGGQAAIMRAQQQLAAQQALQQQQGMLAGLANQQVGNQIGTVQGLGQQALSQQQNVLGAVQGVNTTNANIALANQKSQNGLLGGLLGSVGSGVSSVGGSAHGGRIPEDMSYANGGQVKPPSVEHYRTLPQHTAGSYKDGGEIKYEAPRPINTQPQMMMPPANEPQSRTARMLGGYNTASNDQNPSQAGSQQFGNAIMKQGKNLYNNLTSADTSEDAVGTSYGTAGPASESAAADSAAASAGAETAGEEAVALLANGGELKLGGESDDSSNSKPDDMSSIGGILGSIMNAARGGKVPARISPGEIVLSKNEASSPLKAAKAAKDKEKSGQKVPGKAKVKGDSLKNDTVKASLDEGGIVIPRTHSRDPEMAARFAYATAMKSRKGNK